MTNDYNELAPKFRSRKAFIAWAEKGRNSKLQRGDDLHATEHVNNFLNIKESTLEQFAQGFVGFSDLSHPYKYFLVADALLSGTWNLPAYRNTWLRLFILYQISFYNRERIHLERPSASGGKGTITLPDGMGDLVAMMAIFGNRDLFENALKFSLDAFDGGFIGGNITYLTQLFILQLSEHFLGLTPRAWLNDKHWGVDPRIKEPLFAELWQHWDDETTEVLEPLLIQLLNRHSFQASRNNKDGGRDFEAHSEQFAIEVHFIFRLRQWRGLSNPVLKHRIMEPPFDVLPEPMTDVVFDEQSIQFVNKVRQVFSDFDATVNGARIRDWKMLL
jgi:hypothetical protein